MLKTTFIARASDGLILCETYDSSSSEQGKQFKVLNSTQLFVLLTAERLKINARKLIKQANFGRE